MFQIIDKLENKHRYRDLNENNGLGSLPAEAVI